MFKRKTDTMTNLSRITNWKAKRTKLSCSKVGLRVETSDASFKCKEPNDSSKYEYDLILKPDYNTTGYT